MAAFFVGQNKDSGTDCFESPSQDNSTEPTTKNDAQTEGEHGGWTYKFLDRVEKVKKFEYPICLLPLRDPYLTRCGHNLCKTCLNKQLEQNNPFCPEDKNPISIEDAFPDMKCHRKVMNLLVKCPYAETDQYACNWCGSLTDLLKAHLDACGSEIVTCTRNDCDEQMKKSTFKQHFDSHCLWREVDCYYCQLKIPICKHKIHQGTDCTEFTIPCPNSCEEQMSRKLIQQHLENHCPNRLVGCPFADVGCKDKVTAAMLENHLNTKIGKHLTIAYLDQEGKLKGSKLEQENKIDALTKELRKSEQEKELQKKEQNQKLQEIKEALERQIELFKIELHKMKKEKEVQREEQDQKLKETKETLENQLKFFKTELYEMKKQKEIQKEKQDRKLIEIKEALENQIKLLTREPHELEKEKEVQKEEQDQIMSEIKEALEGQMGFLKKEVHSIKNEKEIQKKEQDQIMTEIKEAPEGQMELLKNEVCNIKKVKEIQKEEQDQKLKKTNEKLQNQIGLSELFKTELHQLKQGKERQKKEHNKKMKEMKGTLENEIKLLKEQLNQSKHEMETLRDNTKQLGLVTYEVDEKIEKQSRCIKQIEQNLIRKTICPSTFTHSDNFSTASALLSFVSKNENPKVLDNLLEFLKEESVFDCQVMKDAWTYRKGDSINFIWFVANYKVQQEKQKKCISADIKSPYFSTGEKGYFFRVRFDPYLYDKSRGTHLSCFLRYEEGQYPDSIKFPHQQEFRVTVVNLRDRQNDASLEKKFKCLGLDCILALLTKATAIKF